MDLMGLLTQQLNDPQALNQLGARVGADPAQVQQAAQLGLPAIMEALSRNASSPQGAAALAGALDQHKDDNVADINGFLQNVDTNDGAKILQHVFADKNAGVQAALAQKSGLDLGQASGLMTMLAPLVLGMLGRQKKEANLDADGVASMTSTLSNMLGQSGSSDLLGMATQFLDANKDGNVIDDLGNMLGGLFRKK